MPPSNRDWATEPRELFLELHAVLESLIDSLSDRVAALERERLAEQIRIKDLSHKVTNMESDVKSLQRDITDKLNHFERLCFGTGDQPGLFEQIRQVRATQRWGYKVVSGIAVLVYGVEKSGLITALLG